MQSWKSSGCTPSAQPLPRSCSKLRPVKLSQVELKKSHRPSSPDIQSITGAWSASRRKRASSPIDGTCGAEVGASGAGAMVRLPLGLGYSERCEMAVEHGRQLGAHGL